MLGTSRRARVLLLVYLEVDADRIRIISARKASNHERNAYEAG
jgi:uncharacterized DUF497 family protein